MFERWARWLYRRYGYVGKSKPVSLWLIECALGRYRPRAHQRHVFLGEAPPPLCVDE